MQTLTLKQQGRINKITFADSFVFSMSLDNSTGAALFPTFISPYP